MPYKLDEAGLCVMNADDGKIEKCHDTHEQALAHLAALQANVEEAKTGYAPMPDDEKALDPDPTGDVAGGYTKSAIVAFKPRPETADLLSGYCQGKMGTAEPAENLHVTLCYITPDITQVDDALEMLKATIAAFAQSVEPLNGKLNGVGRFFDVSANTDCVYTNVDVPGLNTLHEALKQVVRDVIPATPEADEHGFTPHMTLAYVPNNAATQGEVTNSLRLPTIDICLDNVTLLWGDTSYSYPLGAMSDNNGITAEQLEEQQQAEGTKGWGGLLQLLVEMGGVETTEKAIELMSSLFDQLSQNLQDGVEEATADLVFTGKDGLRCAILVSSNGYMDREKEWVRTSALQNYVDKRWIGDKFVQDNDFLLWHEGDPIGVIVFADMEGPYLIELAKELPDREVQLNDDVDEDGDPVEFIYRSTVRKVWDYLEQNPRNIAWGASIGFGYLPRQRGDYLEISKFETSALPVNWAANAQTFVGVLSDGYST